MGKQQPRWTSGPASVSDGRSWAVQTVDWNSSCPSALFILADFCWRWPWVQCFLRFSPPFPRAPIRSADFTLPRRPPPRWLRPSGDNDPCPLAGQVKVPGSVNTAILPAATSIHHVVDRARILHSHCARLQRQQVRSRLPVKRMEIPPLAQRLATNLRFDAPRDRITKCVRSH